MKSVRLRFPLFILIAFGLILKVTAQTENPEQIDVILAEMTLEHKVGQMFMVNLYGAQLTFAGQDMLQTWQPGVVVLMDSNLGSPSELTALINSYQETITEAGGVTSFVATDQEGGTIQRLRDGFTLWPVPMLLNAAQDRDLAFDVGHGMARELRAVGVNMNLAPVADLLTNRANLVIGRRSFGSDPAMVSLTLSSFVQGMQQGGVIATLKHFPGHGDTDMDSHLALPEIDHDLERLEEIELRPFIAGIDAGSGAVMVSHIWFTAFDPETPIPASLSHNMVTGLLRNTLGYDGIVMTDALDMDAIDTRYSPEAASVLAVEAGVDLIAIGANAGEAIQARAMQAVVDAVRQGGIDESRIDESVRRILEAKQRFGLLEWSPLDPETAGDRMDLDAHRELVARTFREGITIAFDLNHILPFDDTTNMAVIYPGSRPSIRQECSGYDENIRWLGVSQYPLDTEIDTARTLSMLVDYVVVFTQDAYDISSQQALVNALLPERTVVVALQSPYDVLRFPEISTYMLTYSPLNSVIPAACSILFGDFPARGTLAVPITDVP